MPDFNDTPISCPGDDRLGIDPLAKTISRCILNLQDPVGSVVAVHGRWGSGKSSLINLVRHHLAGMEAELTVLQFQCWLYRSEEALAIGFFRALHAGLHPVLSDSKKARIALQGFFFRVAPVGPLLGTVTGAALGFPIVDRIVSSSIRGIESLLKTNVSDESLQQEVAEALKASSRRFLFVIDDIDRLSPEEALVIFRLIKSVGRLPNVIYLLAYDRNTTEKAVEERYPSEGAHYLEKIVQAGFDLPEPNQHKLISLLESQIAEVLGDLDSDSSVRFGNMFHAVVAPEIQTPRDVLRLSNALKITYPAVRREVDPTDFLALETLRLFRPKVYQALRSRKSVLVGLGQAWHREQDKIAAQYEQLFLGTEPENDHPLLKDGLQRLFPQLRAIWSNTHPGNSPDWSKARRACSAMHFDTYFQFSLSSYTVPRAEVQELLRRADQAEFVRSAFLGALGELQAEGRTKASFLLDELACHASDMKIQKVGPFLQSLYSIASDLIVESDVDLGLAWTNNWDRLRWLTNAVLLNRTELAERSGILFEALQNASLDWLVYVAHYVFTDHCPPQREKAPARPEECLMSKDDAERINEVALQRIREAAKDGSIFELKELAPVLFRWRNMSGDGSDEVRKFCNAALEDDQSIAKFAQAFLGKSSVVQEGDHVRRIQDDAKINGIETLMDADRFRARLSEVLRESGLSQDDKDKVQRFVTAWDAALK